MKTHARTRTQARIHAHALTHSPTHTNDDVNVLDKKYIYTLNVCATQVLTRKIEEHRNEINDLNRDLQD